MNARDKTPDLMELSLGEHTNSNLISSVQEKPMVLGEHALQVSFCCTIVL